MGQDECSAVSQTATMRVMADALASTFGAKAIAVAKQQACCAEGSIRETWEAIGMLLSVEPVRP